MIRYSERIKLILFALIIVSLFSTGLYTLNNKYTHSRFQPTYGQIAFSEDDLAKTHYLIEDWIFYPALLTPENLRSFGDKQNVNYIDIGDSTRFQDSVSDTSPHGSGTYVLHLWLPDKTLSYSMDVPEIYSSYRLYINGEEYLHVGIPEQDNYQGRTQSKLVTFRESGHVEIMFAVSDYSHFYSGMVYPPMFGTSEKVSQVHELKQSVTLFTFSIGILLTISTLFLGMWMKKNNAILYCILSFIMCIAIFLPYLHIVAELPVIPWYAIELLCIYLMPVLIVVLHNRICEVPKIFKSISTGTAVTFCCIACCYGLASPILTVSVTKAFSIIIYVYKIAVAVYLLITSFLEMEDHTPQVRPIFFASICYAGFLIWDRILPSFEPIFYGWFYDWGNLLLIIAIGYSLIKAVVESYLYQLSFTEELRQMKKQLTMQQEYNRQLTSQEEKHRRFIHDIRQHFRIISVLANKIIATADTSAKQTELLSYLNDVSDVTDSLRDHAVQPFSDNPSVNALLQYYVNFAKIRHIETDFQWIATFDHLSDVELCTMLGNLLENALDACELLPKEQKRLVSVSTKETDHLLFICIENTYDGFVQIKGHRYLSKKTAFKTVGTGIESVCSIVQNHNGTIDILPGNDIFRVGITFPKQKL